MLADILVSCVSIIYFTDSQSYFWLITIATLQSSFIVEQVSVSAVI